MQVISQAICTEEYISKKSGKSYVTFLDLNTGGNFKMVFPQAVNFQPGSEVVNLNVKVKPRIYENGVSLNYVDGELKRSKLAA